MLAGRLPSVTDQPVGVKVAFTVAERPSAGTVLRGEHVVLRHMDPERDAQPLYESSHLPTGDPSIWTYMYDGPYPNLEAFEQALRSQAVSTDPLFFTITRTADWRPMGVASYLAIVPEHGTIEIGNIWFAPDFQRTTGATEAIYLLARHAFDDLGYRRLEWKCNSLNAPSRRAAERFGFQFEGIFAQHRVVKGRNRDTAWYSITDRRWPRIRDGFDAWLSPANFDERGIQRRSLGDAIGPDPAVR